MFFGRTSDEERPGCTRVYLYVRVSEGGIEDEEVNLWVGTSRRVLR